MIVPRVKGLRVTQAGSFLCGWRCGARRSRSTRGEEAQEASGLRDPASFHARHDHNLFL